MRDGAGVLGLLGSYLHQDMTVIHGDLEGAATAFVDDLTLSDRATLKAFLATLPADFDNGMFKGLLRREMGHIAIRLDGKRARRLFDTIREHLAKA